MGAASVQERDAHRTDWLERQGWRILRFWSSELDAEMDLVIEQICRSLLPGGTASADDLAPSPYWSDTPPP